jgi:hypothetical protein
MRKRRRLHPRGATRSPETGMIRGIGGKGWVVIDYLPRTLTTECPSRCDSSTFCVKHQLLPPRLRRELSRAVDGGERYRSAELTPKPYGVRPVINSFDKLRTMRQEQG